VQKTVIGTKRSVHPSLQTDISPHNIEGLQNLWRYFELIIFQAFLQSTELNTLQTYQTFEVFVNNLPGEEQVSYPGILIPIGVISDQNIQERTVRRGD